MSFKYRLRRFLPLLPLLPIAVITMTGYDPAFIENQYARIFYPALAHQLRILSGWIPFSLGDVLYMAAGLFLLVQVVHLIKNLRHSTIKRQQKYKPLLRIWYLLSCTWIVFYLFWGLNYYRRGIAEQMQLQAEGSYSREALKELTTSLLQKINQLRSDPDYETDVFSSHENMFREAASAYAALSRSHPFLQYQSLSVKPSLYGRIGNYGGFLGYYNPFTGEGQINTTCPHFLQPFITCHEIAHQIGYASESEANFIGFLATTQSDNHYMQYSGYLEIYLYAAAKLRMADSSMAQSLHRQLHPLIKKDLKDYKTYLQAHETVWQEWTNTLFDLFLKSNQQPQGIYSYRNVVGWVMGYRKKYGCCKF
jgi:hypothetical protein